MDPRWRAFLVLTALQASAWVAFWLYARESPELPRRRFALGLVLGALFAHLGWFALHLDRTHASPLVLLDPMSGYCVLLVPLGIVVAAGGASRKARERYLCAALRALPAAQATARLGCIVAGCCDGQPAAVAWGVGPLPRHPTRLYEMAALSALALLLGRVPARQVVPVAFVGLGCVRLVVEPWRAVPPLGAPIISASWLAAGWVLVGALVAVRRARTRRGVGRRDRLARR